MATNEMRAWLEEKIKHIEKFIKAYPGSIDIKKARKDMEMMQAILAELELKMTEGERRETLNYFQDIMSSFVNYKTEWNSPKCRKIRDLITGKEAAMEPDITIKEKKNCLINWRERLIEMNDDSDSRDYWSEEQYGDQSMFDSILAELELKMTEWTPDRPCPKEGAALAGPSEEERADMAEYVRELYVGSHNPVENVPDKEGHYPCKFKWCAEKYDKLIKFILGRVAQEGEKS